MLIALIVLGIVVILGIFVVTLYNGLVRARNGVDNAWAQIDVQLKRRFDLIPNLVETVKGYASHERETLEAVIAARNAVVNTGSVADRAASENVFDRRPSSALRARRRPIRTSKPIPTSSRCKRS